MITDIDKVIDLLKSEGPRFDDARAALGRVRALAALVGNEDKPLPEDAQIDSAHPLRSGRHDLYAEAMRLVGAKHSKGALVELVNWLLVERSKAPDTDRECDNCEATFDVENEPAYCYACWNAPWALIEKLITAIDPALSLESDDDGSATEINIAKACAKVRAMHENPLMVVVPTPVTRAEYELLAERITALESRAAKHEAVTRALAVFVHEALDALVDNRKANVKVGLEFRKAIRAAGWDK